MPAIFACALGLIWDKSNAKWYFKGRAGGGGGTIENIYQYGKSRSSLFILLKRDDDLIVTQNVTFEVRQVLRHYCRYYIQRSINEHLHP